MTNHSPNASAGRRLPADPARRGIPREFNSAACVPSGGMRRSSRRSLRPASPSRPGSPGQAARRPTPARWPLRRAVRAQWPHVGGRQDGARDVMSPACQRRHGCGPSAVDLPPNPGGSSASRASQCEFSVIGRAMEAVGVADRKAASPTPSRSASTSLAGLATLSPGTDASSVPCAPVKPALAVAGGMGCRPDGSRSCAGHTPCVDHLPMRVGDHAASAA